MKCSSQLLTTRQQPRKSRSHGQFDVPRWFFWFVLAASQEFLSDWRQGTAKPRLRPRTFADYKKIVEKHLLDPCVVHLGAISWSGDLSLDGPG